jgi:hypothetical protein
MQTLFTAPGVALEVAPQKGHPSNLTMACLTFVRLMNNQAASRQRHLAGADQ